MNAELTDVNEEEDEEAERAVAPVTAAEEEAVRENSPAGGGGGSSPESPVQRSVPADERAGGEEQEPEHGQAKVHPVRRVHAEPGQAAEHVDEERAGVN